MVGVDQHLLPSFNSPATASRSQRSPAPAGWSTVEAYLDTCRTDGLGVLGCFDITEDTIHPFRTCMARRKLGNIGRCMVDMANRYLLVVLEKA